MAQTNGTRHNKTQHGRRLSMFNTLDLRTNQPIAITTMHSNSKKIVSDESKLSLIANKEQSGRNKKMYKNAYCKSRRDCCCFGSGLLLAIIFSTAFFLIFAFSFNSSSNHKDRITAPSSIRFANSSRGSDYIYLEWKAPQSSGGSFIQSYSLQYKYKSNNAVHVDANWTDVFMADKGLLLNANITQLTASTAYQFRINSFNAFFTSSWSEIYNVYTKAAILPSAPSAPFIINIEKNADNKTINVTVAFSKYSDGGAAIDLYAVFYHSLHGAEVKSFCNITSAEIEKFKRHKLNQLNCTGTIRTAENNTIYALGVTATNYVGTSALSAMTACVIPEMDSVEYYMCKLRNVPSKIQQSAISVAISPYEIDVKWLAPLHESDAPILSYELQRDDWMKDESLHSVEIPNDGLSLYAQLQPLTPGSPYQLRIRAVNKYGAAEWSDLVTVTTTETEKCGNYKDLTILKELPQLAPSQEYLKCQLSRNIETCMTSKFQKDWDLSPGCAACEAADSMCVTRVCLKLCMSGQTDKCQQCIADKCHGAFTTCGGLQPQKL